MDKRFIHDSYACRKDKGVHAAVARYQQWSRKYHYALKLDIARYFPSIDRTILKEQLRRRLKDRSVLALFDLILDDTTLERKSGKGLPIGNLTSQVLANVYLDDLDHYIKEQLGAKAYLRYVDDFILLSNDKVELHDWCNGIQDYLKSLVLAVHPRKVNVFEVGRGVDVLGYRVFPDYKLLRNDNGFRFRRKLRRFAESYQIGAMNWEDFNPSVQSWIGHAGQADTLGLRRALFNEVIFHRE